MTQGASELRDELVGEIASWYQLLGVAMSNQVERAMRKVERHLFTPGIPIDKAYADDAVLKKTNSDGVTVSSVSAPGVVAMMLDQLQVQPGHRILEIGSGGYNAALLRELAGPGGSVTTIDIDPDIAGRARRCLAAAGYQDIRVLCGDGELGAAEYGPFDRIIVTAAVWDVAPAFFIGRADCGTDRSPVPGDFQRGEQTRCSMTLIVMGAALGQSGSYREHRLGPFQRLDLRLLVHAQHDGVLGRVHVKPEDIGDLRVKLGIGGKLE